jgi:hypothetical protein
VESGLDKTTEDPDDENTVDVDPAVMPDLKWLCSKPNLPCVRYCQEIEDFKREWTQNRDILKGPFFFFFNHFKKPFY